MMKGGCLNLRVTLTTSPSELITELSCHQVQVFLAGDRLRIRTPWPVAEAPEEVRPLLRELRERQAEVLDHLQQERDRRLFPYPLPETLALGGVDPLDYRYCPERQGMILDVGWWRNIPHRRPH